MFHADDAADCPANSYLLHSVPFEDYNFTMPNGDSYSSAIANHGIDSSGIDRGWVVTFLAISINTGSYTPILLGVPSKGHGTLVADRLQILGTGRTQ